MFPGGAARYKEVHRITVRPLPVHIVPTDKSLIPHIAVVHSDGRPQMVNSNGLIEEAVGRIRMSLQYFIATAG